MDHIAGVAVLMNSHLLETLLDKSREPSALIEPGTNGETDFENVLRADPLHELDIPIKPLDSLLQRSALMEESEVGLNLVTVLVMVTLRMCFEGTHLVIGAATHPVDGLDPAAFAAMKDEIH